MNNYAKYQHHKQKINIKKNHKIAYFYIFRRSKNGPLKEKILKLVFYVLEPR